MKLKTILYGLCYFSASFFLLPYIFSSLTIYLGLPIFRDASLQFVGIVFILVGIINSVYSYVLFFKKGKGTPIPTQPAKKLIVEGLYRYTRNPIYLGHFSILLGYFLFFGYSLLLIYLIIFILHLHFYITLVEEKNWKNDSEKNMLHIPKRCQDIFQNFVSYNSFKWVSASILDHYLTNGLRRDIIL